MSWQNDEQYPQQIMKTMNVQSHLISRYYPVTHCTG